MIVELAFPAFKRVIADVVAAFQASDLGAEAVRDEQAACWIEAREDGLVVQACYRGLDVTGRVPVTSVEKVGRVAVPFGQLSRLSVQAATCRLTREPAGLVVRAGRLKAVFPTVDSAGRATGQAPEPTIELPGPEVKLAVDRVELTQQVDRQPAVVLRVDSAGCRMWTHNPFNAAHTWLPGVQRDQPVDLVVPAAVLRVVAAGGEIVKIGSSSNAITVANATLTVVHPVRAAAIEDLDRAFGSAGTADMAGFVVGADDLSAAFGALKSAGGSSTPATTIDIQVRPDRGRAVLRYQDGQYAVDLQSCGLPGPVGFRTNANMLATLARRLRGQAVKLVPPGDRVWLIADRTTYVMAPIQDAVDEAGVQHA